MSHLPDKGFTLIEIMVVIVIIGVILSFATLSVGDGGQARQLEQEAQRLASLLKLASQESIMQSKEMGVFFETDSYQFSVWHEQKWQTFMAREDIFRPRRLPVGMQIEFHLEGEPIHLNDTKTGTPQLLLLSSGEITPFEVIFITESDDTLRYQLTGTAIGEMSIQKDESY